MLSIVTFDPLTRIDDRDCHACGKMYAGPTCLECREWFQTPYDEWRIGYSPLFTLTQGQIHDQNRKVINGGTYA